MKTHSIGPAHLSISKLEEIISGKESLVLSERAREAVQTCRRYLDEKIKNNPDTSFYGINTGFGKLCDVVIPPNEIEALQENLLLSHACGMGDEVPADIVRLMLILKVQSLSYGHSGIALETVERLIELFNQDCLPIVFQQGSLGASGDLAPLSHMSLPLLGKGEVRWKGKRLEMTEALPQLKWEALRLQSKEGLALINGTQFMGAYGVWALIQAKHLMEVAELITALSIEAFDVKTSPFYSGVHQIRKQPGQATTSSRILKYLEGSAILNRVKKQVQDPYSFRCVPQVHGATRGVLDHVETVFTNEINSVTDNPNVFPEEDLIVSAGNFHGQPLALALDYLAMGLAELGNISERRTFLMLSGERDLPPFLVKDPGLHSGLMIPQYTAASIVSQNKQLCTPASVDSITSSNGQEDHVSMGANAATKCFKVVENLERILAIELLTATQALGFREDFKMSPTLQACYKSYRKHVSFNEADRFLQKDMLASVAFIHDEIKDFLIS